MNPNQPASGQPPVTPQNSGPNPYEFILNPAQPAKKTSPLGGGSMKGRLLIIGGAALILIIVVAILGSLLSGGGNTETLSAVAAEQSEIIRVASLGEKDALGPTAQNLATTASVAVSSDQVKLTGYLASKNVKLSPAQLALKKDATTDLALEKAKQSNTYDEAFTKVIIALLTTYRTDLSKAYDAASNETSKEILKTSFDSATALIKGYTPAETNSAPVTPVP